MRGIHRSPVNSPHKGQWRGAVMFSLICAWINRWVNNRKAGNSPSRPLWRQCNVISVTTCHLPYRDGIALTPSMLRLERSQWTMWYSGCLCPGSLCRTSGTATDLNYVKMTFSFIRICTLLSLCRWLTTNHIVYQYDRHIVAGNQFL